MTEPVSLAPGVHGVLVEPAGAPRAAVLVLAGSSGRVDADRATLLAARGALTLALQWFGGEGQPPGICEVPLETFTTGLDLLQQKAPGLPLGILGLSKGAEAALAVSTVDERVEAVVALAPSHVAWANVGPGLDGETYPYRSSWSWQGRPLPFVSYDESWEPGPPPVANVDLYRRSLTLDPERTAAATIDVAETRADLLLVAGGDDEMWDSLSHAESIVTTRTVAGQQVELVSSPAAGHRVVFPGETAVTPTGQFAHGGHAAADAELGARAWPRVLEVLRLA